MALAFRFAGIPIHIQGSFFFMSLILGASRLQAPGPGPLKIALTAEWIAVVLVSVLLHELGHAIMGRAFGLSPRIDMHAMGGTTSWASREVGPWKSVAISLAGPGAGFLFGGLFLLGARLAGIYPSASPDVSPIVVSAVRDLVFVNILWGVFNLIPMLPLDGGNVLRAVLNGITGGRGETAARVISFIVALGMGAIALAYREFWVAILIGTFLYQNGQYLFRRKTPE